MKLAKIAGQILQKMIRHVDTIVVPGLVVAAIVPFGKLFSDDRYLLLGAGAAAAAAILTLAVSPRLPLPVSIVGAAVIAYLYASVFVFQSFGITEVWNGATGSWSALLTATLPAVSSGTFIALPLLLAFAATFVGCEIALRTGWKVGPVLAPLGVFVVALMFTGKLGMPRPILTLVIILLIFLTVFIRTHTKPDRATAAGPSRGEASPISVAFGLPTLGVIGVLAVGVGAVLPLSSSSRRVDLRDRYHPPIQLSDAITPLAELRSQLDSASTAPVFTVRFSGIPAGMTVDRIPVAALDVYDGAVWGTDASFSLVGHDLPVGPTASAPGPLIHQDYQLGTYPSPFLPALDRPVHAAGKGLAFDRVSGTLAVPTAPPAGYRYSIDSELSIASQPQDTSQVAKEPVKAGNDSAFSVLALPPPQGWPTSITAFAHAHTGTTPYATLRAIADELRSQDFGYSTLALPGHSLGVLGPFLAPPATANDLVAKVGYAEQFAAAFAVLAHVDGFPSRVVVGYRVDPAAAGKGLPIIVRPQQAHAWAEVDLNGVGWVAFDPTNVTPRSPIQPPSTSPPQTVPPVAPTQGGAGGSQKLPGPSASLRHHTSYWWIVVVLVILLLLPLVVVGLKLLRRRQRARTGPAATRVIGAWREARDSLRSHGAPVNGAMTVNETARACRQAIGDDAATRVAAFGTVVNTALYAPFEPEDQAAADAWQAEADLRALLREHSTARQRLLAAVDPRTLIDIGGGGS